MQNLNPSVKALFIINIVFGIPNNIFYLLFMSNLIFWDKSEIFLMIPNNIYSKNLDY